MDDTRSRPPGKRAADVLVTLIRLVCGLAALLLVAHVVLTIGDANPANGITRFVAAWADRLAWGFRDLFTPADATLRVIVNYGAAALVWLVVGGVLTRLLRRATSPYLIS
ncbi:MAG TPA: hypothetical protein VGD67_07600 [Pseudonocardiaceae bacterium]